MINPFKEIKRLSAELGVLKSTVKKLEGKCYELEVESRDLKKRSISTHNFLRDGKYSFKFTIGDPVVLDIYGKKNAKGIIVERFRRDIDPAEFIYANIYKVYFPTLRSTVELDENLILST